LYMRQVEPWLDQTGWGTTWPLLEDTYPDPGCELPLHNQQGGADPTTSAQGHHQNGVNGGSGEGSGGEDSEGDDDTGELEDDDGEDPEQPEVDDFDGSDEEEGANGGQRVSRHIGSRDGASESEGDVTEEEAEEEAEGDGL
jgi:hypothetical protein